MMDIIKAAIILPAYLIAAPAFGYLVLARSRLLERIALLVLVTMPSWFPGKLTLMVFSVELYRGHTKGFEASLIEVLCVAFIASAAARKERGFRWLPPGGWLYLAWCGLSFLSVLTAENKLYTLMAAAKFTKVVLVFAGAFHALKDEEDLRWVGHGLAISLMVQALVGLKLRYLEGRWQVHGWFEHQNPMAMWAYFCALPLLSLTLAPKTSPRDMAVYMGGFAGAGLLILLSISRAALVAFAIGAVIVVGLAALRGFSWEVVGITAVGGFGAVVVSLVALDSFMSRVQEANSHGGDHDLRAILNMQSSAMLHDHFLGVGWNNFGVANSLPVEKYSAILMDWDLSRGFRIIDENYLANPLTESLYWLLLSETGYLGFGGFLVFELFTVYCGVRGLAAFWKTSTGYFVTGILVALVITYLHCTVERVLTQTKNLSLWLMMAGFLVRVEYNRRLGLAPKRAKPGRARAGQPLRTAGPASNPAAALA